MTVLTMSTEGTSDIRAAAYSAQSADIFHQAAQRRGIIRRLVSRALNLVSERELPSVTPRYYFSIFVLIIFRPTRTWVAMSISQTGEKYGLGFIQSQSHTHPVQNSQYDADILQSITTVIFLKLNS
ncbi:hypothetical protein J6590_011773 [Homalodisca vitripennis]|nr:hypothetical protein J6590_011773 [Homalodisca vitripennis]